MRIEMCLFFERGRNVDVALETRGENIYFFCDSSLIKILYIERSPYRCPIF